MRAVVEHRGDLAIHLAEDIFLHYHEGYPRRAYILLGTTVDEGVLAHIHRAAHNVATHVSHQRDRAVEILAELRSVDRVIGGNVQVIGIGGDVGYLGVVGEVLVGAAGYHLHFAEELSLLGGLLGPYAGLHVGGLGFHQVVGHHAELRACPTPEE